MIWSAVSFRSLLSFRPMNIRAVFAVPERKPFELETPGSPCTAFTKKRSFFCIAWNEMSWSAWIEPLIRPVSCCGKKPFGTFA